MIRPVSKEVMIDVKLLSNPEKFYKVKKCVELTNPHDMDLTIEGCQRPVVNDLAVDINNLKENVAIIFQTLRNKCVINIDPAQQDMGVVQEQLGLVLENLRAKMKKSYDEVIAVVVGGRAYDTSNRFADKGIQLTDEICEFMNAEKIPSTKLMEQHLDRHTKGINTHSHRDDAVLTGGIINDFASAVYKAPEKLQETGEKFFDVFEISPHAPVSVVDKIVPRFGTNTKYL